MAEKRVCDRCGKEILSGNAFDSLANSLREHLSVKKFYLTSGTYSLSSSLFPVRQ